MSGGALASRPLVEAAGLSKTFVQLGLFRSSRPVQALKRVDIAIAAGEAVGVVGESGSGKSTLGRLMLGLLPPTEGEVRFDGQSVAAFSSSDWRARRRRMQIVFQDPYGSLDPRRRTQRILLAGETPSPANPPSGCVFRTRCPHAKPACSQEVPALRPMGETRRVACIRAEELQ